MVTSRGVGAAYVDSDYLGFCTPSPDDQATLVEANLAAMWPTFRSAGARCLVVSGFLVTVEERQRFEAAIPAGELTLCRLRARPTTLVSRIMRRGDIEVVGTDDAVSGLTLQGLSEQANRAAGFAANLDADGMADFSVDTDDVAVPEVARQVLQRANQWPPRVRS